jgi:hypothetical protein
MDSSLFFSALKPIGIKRDPSGYPGFSIQPLDVDSGFHRIVYRIFNGLIMGNQSEASIG